ncbi:translocation/assembly module TamB domain-containing protein [Desulfobulbus elongatus]|uniref:translocation/assembly module TamB domain-containing protein n=1 Tax=Desulfobulbus elongatus TaxID=53332 RepID=UPI000481C87C|nr:translocation/assembly module TamB domain-containing protein [Desulfobulbus elongatus]
MGTWLRRLVGLLFLLMFAGIPFLAGTETGLRCLVLVGSRLSSGILTIGAASGTLLGPIHLQEIRYADGIDTVSVGTLDVDWDAAQLANGKLRIRTIQGADVRVVLGEGTGETILTPFALPLDLALDAISAERIAIFSGEDEVWAVARATINDLSFRGRDLHVGDLSLTSDALTFQAEGRLRTDGDYPLELNARFQAHPEGYEPIAGQSAVNGPLNALNIETDTQAPFPAHLNGRLDQLLAATTWRAQLTIPEMTLAAIRRDWPEQRFSRVVINGRGSLDDYILQVQSQAGLPALADAGTLTASIRGDGNGMAVDSLNLAHGETRLAAKGGLTWNPLFSWQAEVSGTHLNPGLFLADWPGDFSGSLTTSGQATAQGMQASFTLPSLHGTLRGFPLTGNGELSLTGNRLHLPHLSIKSGNSVLRASGTVDEAVDLDFRLDSNNLAELWPGARGSIKALARITGSREKPRIDAQVNGSDLAMGTYGLGTLRMEARGVLDRSDLLEVSARAERLRLGTVVMDSSRLLLKGSMEDHNLELRGENAAFSAGLALQGAWKESRWQATLNRSHLSSRQYGDWQQRQPVALTLSASKVEVEPWCLQSASAGSLCIGGTWQPSPLNWHAHGTGSALPLEILSADWMLTWPLTGRIDADFDLTGQQARLLDGKFTATCNDMHLRIPLPDGDTHQVAWKKNGLTARYAGNRLQAVLASEFTDNGTIQAELTSAGDPFSPETLLQAPMSATLRLNLQDLSPLTMLTDQMIHLNGVLRGQLTASGSPTAPAVNGHMELTGGQAEIPPLGILLSPLQLQLTGDNRNARLVATAQSGGGVLRAESILQLDRLSSGLHSVHIAGDGFKAARLPGLDLDVSPDLTFTVGPQRMEVRGTVTVPRARITSIDFHQATAASDDMVIIDEEEAASGTSTAPLFTDITVVAGDDVQVDAYGLRGTIAGKLTISGQPGRPQTGNGTLSVQNGSFTIYGRRLKIDLGRLHFAGGPLTNPGIELRSEKKDEKVTTGVLVEGFLHKPELHFYSSPAMEQAAILTSLLESTAIGGETREETGFIGTAASKVGLGGMVPYLQGVKRLTMIDEIKLDAGEDYDSFSLVFGSWLTPDFYVSYGKDLVKESGSFNTRYTLGKGFSFLTETGESHSGGDIKYEFEH